MSVRKSARPFRVLLAVLAGAGATLFVAGPASAHVQVSADNPQAGARNVTITFTGEAESRTAGIASERVVLPAGISPADVRPAKVPTGWTFATTADGFTMAGPPLPIKQDAVFAVTVAQLPADATELAFKTLETYGDGKVDRWIELQQPGQAEPDNPAPVLKLAPAATQAATTPATAAPTSGAASASTAAAPAPRSAETDDSGIGTWWWLVGAVAVVAVAVGGLALRRRASRG